MSYEGDVEFLCALGHYQRHGCYADAPTICGFHGCTERIEWQHSIDHTNGYDERDPGTFAAPTVEVGWDDIPMTDHYGNKYFVKHVRVQPAPDSPWVKAPTDKEVLAIEAAMEAQYAPFREPADKYRIFSGTTLLFACDTEVEFDSKYEEYLEQGLQELAGYNPS